MAQGILAQRFSPRLVWAATAFIAMLFFYGWWTAFCFKGMRYLTVEELCQRYRDQIKHPELRAAVMSCGRVKQIWPGTVQLERYVNTDVLDFPSDEIRQITLGPCGKIIE